MTGKRGLSIIIVLVLVLAIVGCSGASKDSDRSVVAKVNGEKITKGDFNVIYNQIKQSYQIDDEAGEDPEQMDTIKQLKTEVLDQLIADRLIEQKAKEAGFSVDDKALDRAKEEYENIVADIAIQMEAMGGEQDGDDEKKDYTKEAREYIEGELEAMGQTFDEYIELFAKQMVLDEYIEDLFKDIVADDEEIEEYYNERLQSQKTDIASIDFEEVALYSPLEVRVKHILLKLTDEELDEYRSIMEEGKEEEAKEYMDKKLKDLEPKALEVLDLAKDGQSFEDLIKEYGEDPGMEDNELGYIVRQDGKFVPEFEEAAFKLKDDEISDLVATDFGYHIIKLYERIPEREYSLEEKKDEIEDIIQGQKRIAEFRTRMDKWKEEAKIKIYEDRL